MCNGIKSAKQYDVQKTVITVITLITVITVKQLIQLLVLENNETKSRNKISQKHVIR